MERQRKANFRRRSLRASDRREVLDCKSNKQKAEMQMGRDEADSGIYERSGRRTLRIIELMLVVVRARDKGMNY